MSKYIRNISISLNAVLPKLPDNHDRAHSLVLKQCATGNMVADVLTKGLPDPAFEKHKAKMLEKKSNVCSLCVAFAMVYTRQIG